MYPYPELESLLHLRVTPAQYRHLTAPIRSQGGSLLLGNPAPAYWDLLDFYRFAVCPFGCGGYQSKLDLYSLDGWGAGSALCALPYHSPANSDAYRVCPHWIGIHLFINLHDTPPFLSYYRTSTGEVPFMTPWFFIPEVATRATLSAFPICRIEGDAFVPSYTAFCLTYFSEDPKEILTRHYTREFEIGKGDPEFYPESVKSPGSQHTTTYDETLYDLASWCARGQLGWLDYAEPDLPLRIGAGLALPPLFANVQGDRRGYTYRNGVKGFM